VTSAIIDRMVGLRTRDWARVEALREQEDASIWGVMGVQERVAEYFALCTLLDDASPRDPEDFSEKLARVAKLRVAFAHILAKP
jgi:hypothetical protein